MGHRALANVAGSGSAPVGDIPWQPAFILEKPLTLSVGCLAACTLTAPDYFLMATILPTWLRSSSFCRLSTCTTRSSRLMVSLAVIRSLAW